MCVSAEPFGACNSKAGYAGHVPGGQYFNCFFQNSTPMQRQQEFFRRLMCILIGTTVCADHFHKPAKNIKTGQDEANVIGFHSLMNRFVEILGLYSVPNKLLSTLRSGHLKLCTGDSCLVNKSR